MKKTAGSHVDNECSDAKDSRLSSIEEKLNLLLSVLPELEYCKSRLNEEENKSLQTILEYAQAEVEDLKTKANDAESQQQKANADQSE